MFGKSFVTVVTLAVATGLAVSTASASITIPTVPIGNPGNAPDTRLNTDGTSGYGSVGYAYNIGATEVTNAQYAAFLNAVAASDPNGLYNTDMDRGGVTSITRSGSPGSYTYAAGASRANHPVTYVSFFDACRFANWLHNGQPTGPQGNSTTEDGAYTLTPGGIAANTITRNAGWQWAVPSENEWYKAAYHQPASAGGPSSDYWLFPTSSNTPPTSAEANISIPGFTPVGSYAPNFYGTFDMGGNASEWTEAIGGSGFSRYTRGGSAGGPIINLGADLHILRLPSNDNGSVGFRVVQVPGPSAAALLAVGGLVATRRRR